MNDLISIVIPVYNVEQYISTCIESVLHQTYFHLEIILVDDGSTDASSTICDMYAKKDSRIQVIHKKNGGLSDARNVGIAAAMGTYIGFVDSDDYIHSKMYEILYRNINNQKGDISVVNLKEVTEDMEEEVLTSTIDLQIYNKEEATEELLKGIQIYDYAWNKLYKKSLFDTIRYPVGKKMEDLGTTYLLFLQANKVVYNRAICYYYRQREGSILSTPTTAFHLDKLYLNLQRYQVIKEKYPLMKWNIINTTRCILGEYQYLRESKKNISLREEIISTKKACLQFKKETSKIPVSSYLNKKQKIKLFVFMHSPSLYIKLFR